MGFVCPVSVFGCVRFAISMQQFLVLLDNGIVRCAVAPDAREPGARLVAAEVILAAQVALEAPIECRRCGNLHKRMFCWVLSAA